MGNSSLTCQLSCADFKSIIHNIQYLFFHRYWRLRSSTFVSTKFESEEGSHRWRWIFIFSYLSTVGLGTFPGRKQACVLLKLYTKWIFSISPDLNTLSNQHSLPYRIQKKTCYKTSPVRDKDILVSTLQNPITKTKLFWHTIETNVII